MPENPPNYTPCIAPVKMVVPVCRSLQFIQMLQPCQDNLFAGLFDLARKEDLVQNCVNLLTIPSVVTKRPRPTPKTHLIEVEDEIQFTDIPKELIQNLDKEMNRLEIR